MRRAIWTAVLLIAAFAATAGAWTEDEHRRLALRVFTKLKNTMPPEVAGAVNPAVLAEITARTSRDVMSPTRHHRFAETPLQQVRDITPKKLRAAVDAVLANPPERHDFAPMADNVVANYVYYHTIALHCAAQGTDSTTEWLVHALTFEAVAQGYLADAFSASNLLTPSHHWLASVQDANRKRARKFFSTHGAYVMNGAGIGWRTFGDGMLEWYERPYQSVYEACMSSAIPSLWIFLDHSSAHPTWEKDLGLGADEIDTRAVWLERWKSASSTGVLCMPLVVSATWARSGERSEKPYPWRWESMGTPEQERWHGRVRHWPQVRANGLNDPESGADRRFLYSSDDVFIAPRPDIRDRSASVRYFQTYDVPPSFAGLLLISGGGVLVNNDGGGGVVSSAIGYGIEYSLPLIRVVQSALELEYLYRLGDDDRRVLTPRVVLGLGFPDRIPLAEALHLEAGYAWGLDSPLDDDGMKWGIGFTTEPLRLPFTYAGVSLRAKYERFWLDETLDGFQLQLILR